MERAHSSCKFSILLHKYSSSRQTQTFVYLLISFAVLRVKCNDCLRDIPV